jgi:hypothetical protein
MIDKCHDWTDQLMQHVQTFLQFDLGCDLVFNLISDTHQEDHCVATARNIFAAFDARSESGYQQLVVNLVQVYRSSPAVLEPLTQYEWHKEISKCYFLRALIEYCPREVWAAPAAPFLENPPEFFKTDDSVLVLVAILRRGTTSEQSLIYEQVCPAFAEIAFGEPGWKIAHELISVATVPQKQKLVEPFTLALSQAKTFSPVLEELTYHFLWALPRRDRSEFMEKLRGPLEAMNSPRISKMGD